MKSAYFDCSSGVSGDMILASLIDTGVSPEDIKKELALLPLSGYDLKASEVKRNGFRCTKVDVPLSPDSERPHRSYGDIKKMIEESRLKDQIKKDSIRVFHAIAEAESRVHGTETDKIHFHEVGAVDSIIDIVGGITALSLLGIEKIYASPINVGGGRVQCEHGSLPVPAPATAELLKGTSFYDSGVLRELATPTGVGMVTTLSESVGPMPFMNLDQIGYGAGSEEIKGHANIFRTFIGKARNSFFHDEVSIIETNIDDMNPQFYDTILEKLMGIGALDVFLTPIIMKKSRPAVKITAITSVGKEREVSDYILKNTSTFGIRTYQAGRSILNRKSVEVDTRYGKVTVKIGKLDGKNIKRIPEYEDCKRISAKKGVPIQEIYDEALMIAKEV